MSVHELGDLTRRQRDLESKIDSYFGDDIPHTGDRVYQDLLVQLEQVIDEIEELEYS
jgi:hypothetical protein